MRECRFITLALVVFIGAGFLITGCGKDKVVEMNHAPVGTVRVAIDSIGAGETDTVFADFVDPDGDDLTYNWIYDGGRLFDPDSSSSVWNAPARPQVYKFFIWVSDGTDSTLDSTAVAVDIYTINTENAYWGWSNCENCHSIPAAGPALVTNWQTTSHALTFDSLNAIGLARDENCLPCHTTGWNTSVDNGGYDEFRFPELEAVQCECCHHPGYQHTITHQTDDSLQACVSTDCHSTEDPTVWNWQNSDSLGRTHGEEYVDSTMIFTLEPSVCNTCHKEEHYPHYAQWDSSAHSTSASSTSDACGDQCHTAFGYLDWYYTDIRGHHNYPFTPPRTSIVCLACHDPHVNDHNGQVREDIGFMCRRCHDASQTDNVGETPYHVHGPMFSGTGGYEYPGETYENSDHTEELRLDRCSGCHVSKVTGTATYGYTSNTPHSFDAAIENCQVCHMGITDFNVSGVQDSVTALLGTLAQVLTDNIADSASTEYKQVKFNKEFVENDGSKGVHNAQYAFKLLNDSIENYP
ncbi:MAG: hypothetical protein GY855_06335 [candidate division Zixibacteria bacterium]|nr:hypothetical protein [candidate division Zixibacteria bacterium]